VSEVFYKPAKLFANKGGDATFITGRFIYKYTCKCKKTVFVRGKRFTMLAALSLDGIVALGRILRQEEV
jgi:hypothetical protein